MINREQIVEELLRPFDTEFLKLNFLILQDMMMKYRENIAKRKEWEKRLAKSLKISKQSESGVK